MNRFKFRVWIDDEMLYLGKGDLGSLAWDLDCAGIDTTGSGANAMQYTGLKDKNGSTGVEVYEGDIIDVEGKIKGNIYEMDAGETDLVIQGFGTKTWCKTYNEAISRGCHDSE